MHYDMLTKIRLTIWQFQSKIQMALIKTIYSYCYAVYRNTIDTEIKLH